jgi:hypothetical protein
MDSGSIAILITMIVGFLGIIGSQVGLFNSVNGLTSRVSRLEGIVSSMKEDFGRRLDKLETGAVLTANSPLTLKQGASEVFYNTHVDDLAKTKQDLIFEYIKESGASQNLDIQETAVEAIKKYVIPELDAETKEYLYQHGLTKFDAAKMLGVFIRDLYLEQFV